MKKEGIVLSLLVILILVVSISFVSAESNETEVGNETIGETSETAEEIEVNETAEINETETNETINETEIEYTDEELDEIMPEAGITPDNPLYGMDVFLDNAKATLTPTSLGKTKVRLDIMQERVAEMEEMANKNKAEEAKKAGLQAQKQVQKFEDSVKKIKKIKEKDATELKKQMQRNAEKLETLKQILIDYDSDWADIMLDALELMKTSEIMIADIPEDFALKPNAIFTPGTSTFESMIAQCIESGETAEECEKVEDFCKRFGATTAKSCVEMLSSGFLTPTFRTYGPGERPLDPHNCSGFHKSFITQKKYCCEDTDENHETEHREKTNDRLLNYYYTKGVVDYKVISLRTDKIKHEIFTDSCDGNILTEWECAKRDRMLSEEYECPYGCEDGACIYSCNFDFICDDSEDCLCSDCEGKRNGCERPSWVCHDGSCMPKEVLEHGPGEVLEVIEPGEEFEGECTDSDGGQDYFVKGTTIGKSQTTNLVRPYMDSCMDDSYLGEGFCGENNVLYIESYSCPNGCEDGVCV